MAYTVSLVSSGHAFRVLEGETVLEAALRQGISLPYACRSGYCGSCKARILAGAVHYEAERPALSAEERAQGIALLCQAHPQSDLRIDAPEVTAPAELAVKSLPCKIVEKELLAPDVMRLYLKLPEAQRLQFFAGQYLDVIMDDDTRRSFSIANAPHDDRFLELHIRHVEGGAFTHYIFYDMPLKSIWRIEAPLGSFYLREDSERPVLMMGGGTGFAPLKGMLEHAFHRGDTRPVHLFWGARALPDLYLLDLAREWAQQHAHFQFTPVLSDPQPRDHWQGQTGLAHEILLQHYPELDGYDLYMSGPPAMIDAAQPAFAEHGMRRERLFSDAFEYNTRPSHVA